MSTGIMSAFTSGWEIEKEQLQIWVEEPIEEDRTFWRQVDDFLRRSVESRTKRGTGEQEVELILPYARQVVAPGIAVSNQEYTERYASLDLEACRKRMSPELFKAFVRHIGTIPGVQDLDIDEISTALD